MNANSLKTNNEHIMRLALTRFVDIIYKHYSQNLIKFQLRPA